MNAFVKRLLTVLGALFLLVYVGYQGYQVLYSPIRTETVYSQSMYETVDTRGFTVRNETPITGSASGYLFYSVENGGRVAKNGTIAQIYPSEADALAAAARRSGHGNRPAEKHSGAGDREPRQSRPHRKAADPVRFVPGEQSPFLLLRGPGRPAFRAAVPV